MSGIELLRFMRRYKMPIPHQLQSLESQLSEDPIPTQPLTEVELPAHVVEGFQRLAEINVDNIPSDDKPINMAQRRREQAAAQHELSAAKGSEETGA